MNEPAARRECPVAWSAAVGLAAFAFCLALTPAFPGDGDAGEFTLALALRGVPHPTGYPLYVLAGHAWVTLLHGLGLGWAHAANTWSAAGAGVAAGLLHALAARLAPGRAEVPRAGLALAAALPVALLLFDPAFLREATVAEVTTWQLAAVVALALAAFGALRELADPAVGRAGALRPRLFGMGLAVGAALAHHATSVFFALPLVGAIIFARVRARRLRFSDTLAAWAGAALPLLAHLHTAWRAWHPAAFQWPLLEPSAASVLAHASGRVFAVYLGAFAPRPQEAALLRTAIAPLAIPGLALAGLALARERLSPRGLVFGALLAGALLQLGFVFRYGVPDGVPYFLPVLVVALLGIGAAAAAVARHLARPPVLAAVALALVVYAAFGVAWVGSHHHATGLVAATIRERWRALPFERGFVLWNDDQYTQLVILGLLEHEKPGVVVDNPAMLTWAPQRRAFERRAGFDPLAGLALRDDSDLVLVPPNVARQTPLPVVDFAAWAPGR
jgi:hypothetical protein